ncbi:hypothetical protein GS429_16755 [Natronorubrum sp. JWXQ-INN-674]|uniref:Yip1 domain-containing protein n=1 Tax=Natronorubrum halalkaliphilum TaxID=2691917 RepID=A0A6B0VT26_9EURY|nr:hypothetical protein [Natronorubrum halalkaliphilum]MXV63679.1 hypothetical protein [Natronorubrum halalkaliphilum]
MATGLLRWPVDVLARPKVLVASRADEETDSVAHAIVTSLRISVFYFANLLLYALPLTIAGFGVVNESAAPEGFAAFAEPLVNDPDAAWQLSSALVQNSAFLFVATVLTFVTFHLGVVLTRSSDGIVRSLRTVSYSTGIYLAVMFTVVWYVATAPGIRVADEFLLALQAEFFYFFIDLVGVNLELPGGRPEAVDLGRLTRTGQAMFVVLLLSAVYYLYVLYLGARISHQSTRLEAIIAVFFVTISPAIYVLGVIVTSTL